LIGAEYIMPFNSDKFAEDLEVTVTLERPAIVYVLFDDRGRPPKWLKQSFVDTGLDVGLDEGPYPGTAHALAQGPGQSIDYRFSVWKREVKESGAVVLGPRGGISRGRAMYGIVVAPLEAP